MINQILPLVVRNSPDRITDTRSVISSRLVPNSTTSTRPLNLPIVSRNLNSPGKAHPESTEEIKQYWSATTSTPSLLARFAKNDSTTAKETPADKDQEKHPGNRKPEQGGWEATEETEAPPRLGSGLNNVPFNLLTGTFWHATGTDADHGKNLVKFSSVSAAITRKAISRFEQFRDWLLVLALGGTSWLLTFPLLHTVGFEAVSLALKESLQRYFSKARMLWRWTVDSSSPMQISERTEGIVPVVSINGVIDLNSSPQLLTFLRNKISQKTPKLLIDFSGVTYIDSTGLATLIEYLKGAQVFGGKLALVSLSARIKDVFEVVRLQQIFSLYSDVAASLADLKV